MNSSECCAPIASTRARSLVSSPSILRTASLSLGSTKPLASYQRTIAS